MREKSCDSGLDKRRVQQNPTLLHRLGLDILAFLSTQKSSSKLFFLTKCKTAVLTNIVANYRRAGLTSVVRGRPERDALDIIQPTLSLANLYLHYLNLSHAAHAPLGFPSVT